MKSSFFSFWQALFASLQNRGLLATILMLLLNHILLSFFRLL